MIERLIAVIKNGRSSYELHRQRGACYLSRVDREGRDRKALKSRSAIPADFQDLWSTNSYLQELLFCDTDPDTRDHCRHAALLCWGISFLRLPPILSPKRDDTLVSLLLEMPITCQVIGIIRARTQGHSIDIHSLRLIHLFGIPVTMTS